MPHQILIVDQDHALLTSLRCNFEKEGFIVRTATSGETVLDTVAKHKPDLLLVEWNLPVLSGVEICRQVRTSREWRTLPVILLSDRTEEPDKVRGLNSGADDYVAKPFGNQELVARVRAVLRRTNPPSEERLTFSDLVMDLDKRMVFRAGRPVHLGPTEFRLLRCLLGRPGRIFTREQLLDQVWGSSVFIEDRTIDVHIRRLRQVLNAVGEADLIRTVRSVGYGLRERHERETSSWSASIAPKPRRIRRDYTNEEFRVA